MFKTESMKKKGQRRLMKKKMRKTKTKEREREIRENSVGRERGREYKRMKGGPLDCAWLDGCPQ